MRPGRGSGSWLASDASRPSIYSSIPDPCPDAPDFLAFTVPSALFIWILGVVFERVLLVPFPITTTGGVGESLLFLIVAYFSGHIVQALANRLENWLKARRWCGFPSARYWRDDDPHFPPEMKAQLKQAALTYLGLPATTDAETVFNLVHTVCVQKGLSEHVERFSSLYQLYRGLVVATAVCSVGFVLAFVVGRGVTASALSPNVERLQTGILAVLAAAACWLFLQRLERFSGRFADAVYRAFYVYHRGEHNDQ